MFIFLAFLYNYKHVRTLIYIFFTLSIIGFILKFMYLYHTNNYMLEDELNIIRGFQNKPILFISYTTNNYRNFYARKMLENYIDITKDFGNYEFLEPYEVNMGFFKDSFLITRGWLFTLKNNQNFKHLANKIYSKKIIQEYMFFPLDEVIKIFKNKIILIISMGDTSDVIKKSEYFLKFLKETGSQLPQNLCRGIAYVGLFYKGKLIKETYGKSGEARLIIEDVNSIKGLRIPGKLIAFSYGMKNCNKEQSVLDVKVSFKTEQGMRSFYMTFVSNVIFIGRKNYEANDKGLHVFIFNKDWNLIKHYIYYREPYEYNDMFLVK